MQYYYNWKRLKSLEIRSVQEFGRKSYIIAVHRGASLKMKKLMRIILFLTKISTQETGKKNLRFVYFYKGKISFARLYLLLAI